MIGHRARCWLIGIDGRSGAGKTTLATALAQICDAPVVSLDDLYPGWSGLEAGVDRLVTGVLEPLVMGRSGSFPRHNWLTGLPGSTSLVPFAPTVIVEGCGALARRCRPFLSHQIWLDVPTDVRYARAMARDGEAYRPHWQTWAEQESQHYRLNPPPR